MDPHVSRCSGWLLGDVRSSLCFLILETLTTEISELCEVSSSCSIYYIYFPFKNYEKPLPMGRTRSSKTSSAPEDTDPEYEVEAIVDVRRRRGRRQYLLK